MCNCPFHPPEPPRITLTLTFTFYSSLSSLQVDLALSFQDNAGCLDIWRQITLVQSRAAEWFHQGEKTNATDMAHAVAAAHHASLQRQEQHAMWEHVASEAQANNNHKDEGNAEAVAVSMAAAAAAAYGNESTQATLPNPPTLQNLEEIADIIAAAQVSSYWCVSL